jgi:hypothetical protein
MNAPTRADVLSLVKQRFPKQSPADVVLRWVEELMEVSEDGVAILDAAFPDTLGVELDAQPGLVRRSPLHAGAIPPDSLVGR